MDQTQNCNGKNGVWCGSSRKLPIITINYPPKPKTNQRETRETRERERDLGSNDLPNLQREERRKRSNIWIRNKERRRCCPQLPDLALRLLHPEPTQCSFSIFAVSSRFSFLLTSHASPNPRFHLRFVKLWSDSGELESDLALICVRPS